MKHCPRAQECSWRAVFKIFSMVIIFLFWSFENIYKIISYFYSNHYIDIDSHVKLLSKRIIFEEIKVLQIYWFETWRLASTIFFSKISILHVCFKLFAVFGIKILVNKSFLRARSMFRMIRLLFLFDCLNVVTVTVAYLFVHERNEWIC